MPLDRAHLQNVFPLTNWRKILIPSLTGLKAHSYCLPLTLWQTVAFLQRDREVSISTLTLSAAEKTQTIVYNLNESFVLHKTWADKYLTNKVQQKRFVESFQHIIAKSLLEPLSEHRLYQFLCNTNLSRECVWERVMITVIALRSETMKADKESKNNPMWSFKSW